MSLRKRTIDRMLKGSLVAGLTVGLLFGFTACTDQSPFQPDKDEAKIDATALAKKGGHGNAQGGNGNNGNNDNGNKGRVNDGNPNHSDLSFPLFASKTYRWHNGFDYYRGGDLEFSEDNKSKFKLEDDALTPPPYVRAGDDVTISMKIDFDQEKNELIYTFGPHGCQFDPPAEIKLDYGALGIETPVLYYIDDNGDYIEQRPEHIEVNKRWLMISVDHFSRYAVGWGENFR